jgi:hypothetical protein
VENVVAENVAVKNGRSPAGRRWGVCVGVALFAAGMANAAGRVYVVDFQGSCEANINIAFWNDCVLIDSILRTETENVDTIISLFGSPKDTNYIRNILWSKYKHRFIDGAASVANLDTITQWLAQTLDSTDILVCWIGGHGRWELWNGEYHSNTEAWDYPVSLVDTVLANFTRRIPGYKLFVLWSCQTFGNGRHIDSCGFATHLVFNKPESIRNKTVLLSGAGPQPKWSTMLADDRPAPGCERILGCEIEYYGGVTYQHAEFLFHILTGFNGGAEPSEYWSRNGAPGFFKDSIDANRDDRISIGETFRWDRRRSTRLGYEDNQMVDSGRIANRFVVWPRIELIHLLDASPVAFLPDTVDSGVAVVPRVVAHNLGLAQVSVSARLRIGLGFDTTASRDIGPNQRDTIRFPAWTPLELGWHVVKCSTTLAGDEDPSNDVLVESVYVRPAQVGVAGPPALPEPLPVPELTATVLSRLAFSRWLASPGCEQVAVYDRTGRRLDAAPSAEGVYYLRIPARPARKVILTR